MASKARFNFSSWLYRWGFRYRKADNFSFYIEREDVRLVFLLINSDNMKALHCFELRCARKKQKL